ncbi:MAG: TIR domain-containing protein [Nitrospirota bacterium]
MNGDFEIFCSYAHGDNDDSWVESFATALTKVYRKLTGQAPRVFMDRESLVTADIWETKICSALQVSQVLIAVISPSYIQSEWCQREWAMFSQRETEFREQKLLADEQGLIFPILLFPLDRGRFSKHQQDFSAVVKQRQWLDVSSQLEGTPIRPDQVRHIAERLIDTIAELEQRRRRSASAVSSAVSGATIRDPRSGLEWSAALSPTEMSFEAALKYMAELDIGGAQGWRLPTKVELESIIDPAALTDDPKASPFPLREPFNAQRAGYLHSGTLVDTPAGGNFVMNIRNGHIFNGKGHDCYVRVVRGLSNSGKQPAAFGLG